MNELLKMLDATSNVQTLFVFFIPGFISLLVGGMIGPVPESDFAKRVVAAVGYSALNFLAMTSALNIVDVLGLGSADFIVKDLFLYILPFIYPYIVFRMREKQMFGFSTPFPNVWDQFFARRTRSYYVRAYLKGNENKFILGRYSDRSISSQSPAEQMLLLEAIYDEDSQGNWVLRNGTAGFLLPMSECRWIEFINT